MVQGAWGVVPAHINELSPDSVRGFLPGFGYQCGVLLASSIVYLEALFAERISYSRAMASVAGIVFTLAIVIAILVRERRGTAFGHIRDRDAPSPPNYSPPPPGSSDPPTPYFSITVYRYLRANPADRAAVDRLPPSRANRRVRYSRSNRSIT